MELEKTFEEDIELALELMKANSLKDKKSYGNNKNYKIKNKDDFITTSCKVCKIEFKISCKYDGNYPLCYFHRDPNNR